MLFSSLRKSVLLVLGCFTLVSATETIVTVEGSSVMLDAPLIKNVTLIQWEYLGTGPPMFILQFYVESEAPTIFPAYRGRVVFHPENGSILLQQLREADSGVYKVTVDLIQATARMTLLKVIKPVPQPQLRFRSNLTDCPIELVCVVPEGTVASISWKKDGQPFSPEKYAMLSENNTVLQIRRVEKSDCSSYSCNISNAVSWREASLNLTVTGLTGPLRTVWMLAPSTLMFVASSVINFMLLFWLKNQDRLKKEEWYIYLSAHLLLCISSLLLLASSIIWMQEDGFSAAFLLLVLFLFAAVIETAWAAVEAVWRPAALTYSESHVWRWTIHTSTVSTTVILNLLFAVLLLHNVQRIHERGCSESVNLVPSCVPTAVVIVFILLLFFLLYHRNKQVERVRNPPSCQSTAPVTAAALVMEESQGARQEEE